MGCKYLNQKFTDTYYKFIPIGILFLASVTTIQGRFYRCRELNDAKPALINGKLIDILGVINLNKINNCDYIKRKSFWLTLTLKAYKTLEKRITFLFHVKHVH